MYERHFDRVREMFADQFEPDGENFIYRKHGKGVAIPVSALERDNYIHAFNTFLKHETWWLVGALAALCVAFVAYGTITGTDPSDLKFYGGLSLIFAAFSGAYYWAWNLPTRELRGRKAIGQALSREEVRRRFFSKITYGELALAAAPGLVLLIWLVSKKGDLLRGWNILWLAFVGLLFIGAAIQAFRKWRFDSQQNHG